MEPLPATLETIQELTRDGDTELAAALARMSLDVVKIAPECVGLSLSLVEEGLTLTMTASDQPIGVLDGFQYLDDGPCQRAADDGDVIAWDNDSVLDETHWRLFAEASTAAGVCSTLSLPILRRDTVVAVVNLYGGTHDAFDGRHQELASACGAWAGGATTNADLAFSTSWAAREAPGKIHRNDTVEQAVGVLAVLLEVGPEEARRKLQEAARRAAVAVATLAAAVLEVTRRER